MNCNEVEWGVAAAMAMAARRASTPTIKSYSTGASQELAYNFAQKVVYSVSCAPLAPGSRSPEWEQAQGWTGMVG